MSGDGQIVTGGQGVAGSNPAVPTQVTGLITDLGSALETTSFRLGYFWRFLTAGQGPERGSKSGRRQVTSRPAGYPVDDAVGLV
jgi:hypothetical protein